MKNAALVLLLFFASATAARADEAYDLLKASDRARGGFEDGLTWEVRLRSWEGGRESDRTFSVKARGVDAIVEALQPAKFKGETYLFNDRTMWFFKPSLRKPIAISARQKLTGQAANGDIASTNYARDYDAVVEKADVVGGQKTKVLLLKAKSEQVTYDKIRYWVSEKTKQAVKAEFMSLQGKPFKTATFEYKNSIVIGGKPQPFISRMTIEDVKAKGDRSVMEYSKPKVVKHPIAIFNVNNLSR